MKKCIALLLALVMVVASIAVGYAETAYTGSARGFGGDVTAQVTIDADGKVIGLIVDAKNETAGIGDAAVEPMVKAILEAGNAQVDGVAGATLTSTAIKAAVNAALTEAGVLESVVEQSYIPGTYTGVAKGRNGDISVEVTVSQNKIEAVVVTSSSESAGVSDMPIEVIPQDIVAFQSLGVDAITGASLTSYGIINAAANALEQAGANVDALRAVPAVKEPDPVEDIETEIVIAGGGMAGLMTAVIAADQGADVVVLEKLPFLGGSLELSAGGFAVAATNQHMKEIGMENDLESAMDWVRRANKNAYHQPDYEFVEYLLSETGKTDDYMTYELGMESMVFEPSDAFMLFDTCYGGMRFGAGVVDTLVARLEEKGAKLIVNAAADEIIMEDGKAVGLKVKAPGGDFTVTAKKVILATGGANYDQERMVSVTPSLNRMAVDHQPLVGNTGDGFRMLEQIGAKMGDGPFIKASSALSYASAFGLTWLNTPKAHNNLIFDADGIRFIREDQGLAEGTTSGLTVEVIRHGSEAVYALFDTHNVNEALLEKFKEFADQDNKLIVVYGKNIEEIAEKLDIDPVTLKATYDRYQTLCANGVDIDRGKAAECLIPYNEDGGLYAAYMRPGSYGTIGGAITDKQFRVLNDEGNPIENLFAVGEVASSTMFGDYYMGSFSLGYYATAGRLAAEAAVAEISAE